jgi:hypothetical protein
MRVHMMLATAVATRDRARAKQAFPPRAVSLRAGQTLALPSVPRP